MEPGGAEQLRHPERLVGLLRVLRRTELSTVLP
jgi:hypothetical protein